MLKVFARCIKTRLAPTLQPGESLTNPPARTILPMESSVVATGISYTSLFKNFQKKKSTNNRSDDHDGHAIRPPRTIQPPENVDCICAWTSVLKCIVAPSC